MSEQKLKPCPFCGGKAKLMDMGYPHWVYCENCGAKVHGRTFYEKDSIDLWNRRAIGTCKDCPLIEIQDHGDLIDKSVLYDHIKDGYDIDLQENPILLNAILEMVDYQEAVIQADKEES